MMNFKCGTFRHKNIFLVLLHLRCQHKTGYRYDKPIESQDSIDILVYKIRSIVNKHVNGILKSETQDTFHVTRRKKEDIGLVERDVTSLEFLDIFK